MERTHEQQIERFNEYFKSSESAISAYNICEELCKALNLDAVKTVNDNYYDALNKAIKSLSDSDLQEIVSYFNYYKPIVDGEVFKHYKDIKPVMNKLTTISITSNGVSFEHNLESVEPIYCEQVINMIELITFYIIGYYVLEAIQAK